MAAPYYVAVGGAAAGNNASVSPAAPSGTLLTGDIIVVIAATWNPDTLTCSATGVEDNSGASGFETVYTGNGSDEGRISVFAGRLTGTLGTITVAGASESIVARAFAVRGAVSSGAFIGTESEIPGYKMQYPTTSSTVSWNTLSTDAADTMVVLAAGWDDNTNVSGRSAGNLTEDGFFYGITNQGSDSGYGILFGTLATAGSIGSPTFTLAAAEHYGSCFFTIIPAPASGGKVPAMDNAYRQRRAA